MSVIGHSGWCGRKGKFANMSGNYCSECGQVVLLKTGKTDEEKRLAEQLQGAVEDRDALVHAMQSIAGKTNPSGEYCQAVARAALNNHVGGQS